MRTLSILGQSLLFQVAGYDFTLVFIPAGIKIMAILGCFTLCIPMKTLYHFHAGSPDCAPASCEDGTSLPTLHSQAVHTC